MTTLCSIIQRWSEFDEQAAVIALRKKDAQRLTYDDLREKSLRFAAGLANDGVERGDRVALLAPPGPEWIIAAAGALAAGAVVVPVDTQTGAETLAHIIDDADPRLIMTTESLAERLNELENSPAAAQIAIIDVGEEDHARHWSRFMRETPAEPADVHPEDFAVLFYTSGTTGPPKGVPLTHANLVFQLNRVIEMKLVREDDVMLAPLPFHHVYPFSIGLFVPLSLGIPIVVPHSLTGPQVQRALREGKATIILGVPRLYRALADGIETRARSSGRIAHAVFRLALGASDRVNRWLHWRIGKLLLKPLHRQFGAQVRMLASGGSPLDPALARRLQAFGWDVAIGYGLTETSPLLTVNAGRDFNPETVGRAMQGIELRIDQSSAPGAEPQDESEDEAAQRGENEAAPANRSTTIDNYPLGEILARGPGVFSGYRNLPEKTEEAFTDGWFRTGDLGYIDDDEHLHITGRASTVIVTEAGKNVQPDEIEDAYAASPAIREVGALQKGNRLVALIVPAAAPPGGDGAASAKEALRSAVEEQGRKLPSYQRISDFEVTREALPRTRLGKLRRHVLAERYEQAARGEDASLETGGGPMPIEEMSGEDRALIEDYAAGVVWQWITERHPDRRITPDTSPASELGVDSMEWLNLTMEIRARAGVELDEEAIGRVETVRDLLREVTEASESKGAGVDPLEHPEDVLSERQKKYLDPLGPIGAASRWIILVINSALIRVLFPVRVTGREHVPPSGPLIIVANHESHLDPFAIGAALGVGRLRDVYWAGFTGAAFGNPFTRLGSRLGQAVPIDPKQGAGSALAVAAYILKRDRTLVWFPEGMRSPTGELLEFRPGVGVLIERFGVPVLPVLIEGTHEAMPVGAALPKPRRLAVTFGPVMSADELNRSGADGDEARMRIVEALHDRIAAMKK